MSPLVLGIALVTGAMEILLVEGAPFFWGKGMVLGVHAITTGVTVLHTYHWEGGFVAHSPTALPAELAQDHGKNIREVHCTEQPGYGKHSRKS